MSQWLKMGVKIRDLDIFQAVCEKYNLSFNRGTLKITDSKDGHFSLIDEKDGSYSIYADNDIKWNPLAKRLPRGMDTISRDYTQMLIEQNYQSVGGYVEDVTENKDGSITLSIAVGY